MRTGIILGKQEVCFASVNANVAFKGLGVCFYKNMTSPNKFWIDILFVLWCWIYFYHIPGRESEIRCDNIDQIYVVSKIIIVHVTTCEYWRFESPVQKLIFHCRYSSQAFTVLGCHYCQLQASLWMCICWSIWGTFVSRSQAVIRADFCYNTIFFLWCGDVHCCCDHLLR